MKTKFLIVAIAVFWLGSVLGQTPESHQSDENPKELKFDKYLNLIVPSDPVTMPSDQLVSNRTFHKLVLEDLSYLLLGETSPSQGLEALFAEDKSKISLSGAIGSWGNGFATAKGEFTADNGVYFFEETNGSKSAKVSANFYWAFGSFRNFSSFKSSLDNKRYLYQSELTKRQTIQNLVKDYYYLHTILTNLGIPVEPISKNGTANNLSPNTKVYNSIIEKINKTVKQFNYSNVEITPVNLRPENIQEYIKSKKLSTEKKSDKLKLLIDYKDEEDNRSDTNRLIPFSTNEQELGEVDKVKLIKLYHSTIAAIDTLKTTLSTIESKTVAKAWNRKSISYIGITPSYEREQLKNVYQFKEGENFNDLFSDQTGDLFGLEAQIGFFLQNKKRSYLPKMLFAKLNVGYGRVSNMSDANPKNIKITDSVGGNVGEDEILFINEKEANIFEEGIEYDYGAKFYTSAEVYWYPYDRLGLFSQFGYNNIEFDSKSNGKDMKFFNWRVGCLINLKNKKKNFATLQFFLDRSDLSKKPTGKDADLRFGFKVGLPFNFKKDL